MSRGSVGDMRVVVVGAGVIGAASAYHLVRNGHDVVVIEAGRIGLGASWGNAGWICPAETGPVAAPGMVLQGLKWMLRPDSPLYIKPRPSLPFARFLLQTAAKCNERDYRAGLRANIGFFADSMQWFDEYRRDGVDYEMYSQGLLMAFLGEEKYEHHAHDLDIAEAAGLEPRRLTGDALHEQEPALSRNVKAGIYYPYERGIRSESITPALVRRARELGVEFKENTPFEGVVTTGDRVTAVKTPDGRILCDAVVVAAGVWTARVAKHFGVSLPIEPGKGYSIEYANPPVQLRQPISFTEMKCVGTPLGSALRLAGTMEFSGFDADVNRTRVDAIRTAPTQFLDNWDAPQPSTEPWAGFRPMTPDSLSIVGKLGRYDNAYVASGHGMYGVTLAPATASAVVEMVESRTVPERLAPFSPKRFSLR